MLIMDIGLRFNIHISNSAVHAMLILRSKNIYEVNTNFGSASDLVALSEALHARGMVCSIRLCFEEWMLKGSSSLWLMSLQITWAMQAVGIA